MNCAINDTTLTLSDYYFLQSDLVGYLRQFEPVGQHCQWGNPDIAPVDAMIAGLPATQ